jgi:transposase
MMCPVEIANEMSAFATRLQVEQPAGGRHGFLSAVRHGGAMKIQEAILRAMAKKISWSQAAEIIGISDRQMRRWYERYREFGYDGLFDRRLRRPSPKRVPVETVEQVLGLYREKYFDLNVRHFVEKLREQHGIGLSYTWIKTALQGSGLVKKARSRGVHRRRRARRPLPGMLLHLDGSRHRWFLDDRW